MGSIAIWLVLRLVIFEIASVVLHLPILADPLLWVVFALSVAEAFLLNFYIQFMIASLAFWAEAIFGVRDIVLGVESLLAGQMIPLSLFPASVRVLAARMLFQFTLFVPAAVYLQHYSRPEALRQLGIETLWVAALFILSRLLGARPETVRITRADSISAVVTPPCMSARIGAIQRLAPQAHLFTRA